MLLQIYIYNDNRKKYIFYCFFSILLCLNLNFLLASERVLKNFWGIEFVEIPRGSYFYPEKHLNSVILKRIKIENSFYMQTKEVNLNFWEKIANQNKPFTKDGKYPAQAFSKNVIMEFISKLNKIDLVFSYRLPTVEEWEYACLSGSTNEFSTGLYLDPRYANFDYDSPENPEWPAEILQGLKPIKLNKVFESGILKPNSFGLYDMHGNLWEWCEKAGGVKDGEAVLKGGSYFYGSNLCSAYIRNVKNSSFFYKDAGFRLILEKKKRKQDRR